MPSPVPPSPVPPGPGPSPVPPGPGPSPVPGPVPPVFPPPLVIDKTDAASNGLPAYTMPPSSGPTGVLPPMSYGTPGYPANPGNIEMTQPVGMVTPGNIDMTMPVNMLTQGSPDMTMPVNNIDMTMPVNMVPPGASPDATMPVSVPGQRGHDHFGTLYGTGGYPALQMPMPMHDPVENSGSLTGHILAQGWHDAPVDERRSNFKVVLAMLAVLGLLVTVSLVFVLTAGSAFTDMLGGLFN
ncbi:hypothetical protein [Actinoplanes sp. NPDC051851]|uniref:hypothetical protein n=1 Tax=Actinoplanes sp. NPDC051851 TaxID=3154753 RepID=UPI00342060A0